jgi:hypothetical protein
MLSTAVTQFHSEIGDPKGSIKALKEAKHVATSCGQVLREAFPVSSFRFIMKNVMTAAQRLWERKCVLSMPSMMPVTAADKSSEMGTEL